MGIFFNNWVAKWGHHWVKATQLSKLFYLHQIPKRTFNLLFTERNPNFLSNWSNGQSWWINMNWLHCKYESLHALQRIRGKRDTKLWTLALFRNVNDSLTGEKLLQRWSRTASWQMCHHTSFAGKARNLSINRNRGQQRHPAWARKGGSYSCLLAIATETSAVSLENIVAPNLSEYCCFSDAAGVWQF